MKYGFNRINEIPVRTWRWLKVNYTSLSGEVEDSRETGATVKYIPDGFTVQVFSELRPAAFQRIVPPPTGAETALFVKENQNTGFDIRLKRGVVQEEPLILRVETSDDMAAVIENTRITIEQGSRGSVVFVIGSRTRKKTLYAGFTQVCVKERAELKIVRIQNLDPAADAVSDLRAQIDANAGCDVFLADLGAERSVSGCEIDLLGDSARSDLYSLYMGDGERRLDMNYRVNFRAAATQGRIVAKGVLQDRSKKVFRDTLDFREGSRGATGREDETTLVLGSGAGNISVPLLLCAEDEISGEHATSSGKLDENKIFYLMSRGLSYDDAKRVLVEGTFAEMLERIPDETLRGELLEDIGRRLTLS